MDPPPADDSRRRAPSRGGKSRGGKQLGLKKTSGTTPSPHPGYSPAPPPVPPSQLPISSPAAPNPSSAMPNPTPSAPTSSPVVPTSTMPPRPPHGARWGAIPPNFALHGNQQGPTSWLYPPGGFVNLMEQPHYPQQPQVQGENFHLVGQPMSFNPVSQSPPPPQHVNSTKPVSIDIDEDDNNGANRPVQKRYWSHEEEERLASAWLNASTDPIKGNDKKGDTFWKEVTYEYNNKGNGKPRREINQLKVHWSHLKSSITDFNDAWTKVTQMHTSGYSDDMLEEEAQKVYESRFGKRFLLVHWWKILKEEPKWCAQFETQKDKSEIVDVPEEQSRPIGREAAKAERSGKRKKENIMEGIVILGDNIEKIVKMQEDRKVEREKVTEAQIQISNANLKAAKEQKEARMFEVYNSLLNQDTSHMSEDQMANRDKAIRMLEEKLFVV